MLRICRLAWPARAWAPVLALGLALGCQSTFEPPPTPLSPAALAEASAVLRGAAEDRDDLRVVEGGLWLNAYGYEWVEHDSRSFADAADPTLGSMFGASLGSVRRRVMSGPHEVYVPMERLLGVRARSWPLGSAIELDLAGASEPAVLQVDDREEAERLAGALDLLRRAGGAP